MAESIRIRSKCDWYEHGKKSTKFFLNLEKKHDNQNQIHKLIIDEKEIDGDVEIFKENRKFQWNTFQKSVFQKCKWNWKIFIWYYYSVSQQQSNKSLWKRLIWNWFIQCNEKYAK